MAPPPSLRSIQQTREFVSLNGGHGVVVEVHAADGLASASAMWNVLSERRLRRGWEVENLAHLRDAAALNAPVSSARSATRRLIAKLAESLVRRGAAEGGARAQGGTSSFGGAQGGARARGGTRVFGGAQGGARATHSFGGAQGGARVVLAPGRGSRGANGGLVFGDSSSGASTEEPIDELRDAERAIRSTSSRALLRRAGLVSDEIKGARLALRRFAEAFAKLDDRARRHRWNATSQRRFNALESRRVLVRDRLQSLRRLLQVFADSTIYFA